MAAKVWTVFSGKDLTLMEAVANKQTGSSLATSEEEVANWRLWRVALARLRKHPEFGYGFQVEVAWLEKELCCRRESSEFAFSMLEMREAMEQEDGLYFGMQTVIEPDSGARKEFYVVPSAAEHENVCRVFERKMRRLAGRAMELRNRTLANPAAELSTQERQQMEKGAEIAAFRALFLKREGKAIGALRQHAPALLEEREGEN